MADGGSFRIHVPLSPNKVNDLFVTGRYGDGTPTAPTLASVTQDATSPSLFIVFPAEGAEITTDTTDVAGRVGGMESGFMGLAVNVNRLPAILDEGVGSRGVSFRMSLPLQPGEFCPTAPSPSTASLVDRIQQAYNHILGTAVGTGSNWS